MASHTISNYILNLNITVYLRSKKIFRDYKTVNLFNFISNDFKMNYCLKLSSKFCK